MKIFYTDHYVLAIGSRCGSTHFCASASRRRGCPAARQTGFPWTPQMVGRSRRSSGATNEASRAAMEKGIGLNLAGGTHHALRDCDEGCGVFNESAIAALAMPAEDRVWPIAIRDCDAHQGNGTALILANGPTAFPFSIHGARNISDTVDIHFSTAEVAAHFSALRNNPSPFARR